MTFTYYRRTGEHGRWLRPRSHAALVRDAGDGDRRDPVARLRDLVSRVFTLSS